MEAFPGVVLFTGPDGVDIVSYHPRLKEVLVVDVTGASRG